MSFIFLTSCSQELENENNVVDDGMSPIGSNERTNDDVLAIVNGEEISSQEVTQAEQNYVQQGVQVSQEEVIENLINQKVLEQEVEKQNLYVSDEEVETMIESQLAMQNATLEEYKLQFESQEISYEEQLQELKKEMIYQSYFETILEGISFDISDEEVNEFYDLYKEQSPEELPPLEDIRPQIVATLEQQKQQDAIDLHVQELRENADVEYN